MINKTKRILIKKCPICNNGNFRKVFKNKWKISSFVECKKCKLIFKNPQENIDKTISRYNIDYFNYELKNQYNFFNLIKKTLDDFDIINILPNEANILEIGSATGLFLKYMDSLSFKTIGIELCKESVEYGKKEYGVNLVKGKLEDFNFKQEFFDFIHFSHLIEHLNDPVNFLLNVFYLLKKDGYALITTPNTYGLFSKYYRESWRCIVDDHLFIFNINNLKLLLNKLNFKIVKYKTWGSIPEGKTNKIIKKIFDWLVKRTNLGDVVCFLVQK